MTEKHHRIRDLMNRSVWYITPEKAEQIVAFINARLLDGIRLDFPQRETTLEDVVPPSGTALIRVFGTIGYRMNLMADYSGGTSIRMLAGQIRASLANPDIQRIVLEFDSPGGEATGIPELADMIWKASKQKEIIAVAEPQACSAAHFLASACTRFYACKSSVVGSIGAILIHQDRSAQNSYFGIKHSIIASSPGKAYGNSLEPLSDDARDYLMRIVKECHMTFAEHVAKYRNLSLDHVLTSCASGITFSGAEAKDLGLVDDYATLADVIHEPASKTTVYVPMEVKMEEQTSDANEVSALTEQLARANERLKMLEVELAIAEAGNKITEENREAMVRLAMTDMALFKDVVQTLPDAKPSGKAPVGSLSVSMNDKPNETPRVDGVPIRGVQSDTELAEAAVKMSAAMNISFADAVRRILRGA